MRVFKVCLLLPPSEKVCVEKQPCSEVVTEALNMSANYLKIIPTSYETKNLQLETGRYIRAYTYFLTKEWGCEDMCKHICIISLCSPIIQFKWSKPQNQSTHCHVLSGYQPLESWLVFYWKHTSKSLGKNLEYSSPILCCLIQSIHQKQRWNMT